MDYCYTCRRILNRALVCPGCGAYAPEVDATAAAAPAATDPRFGGTYPTEGHLPTGQGEFAPTGYAPDGYGAPAGYSTPPGHGTPAAYRTPPAPAPAPYIPA